MGSYASGVVETRGVTHHEFSLARQRELPVRATHALPYLPAFFRLNLEQFVRLRPERHASSLSSHTIVSASGVLRIATLSQSPSFGGQPSAKQRAGGVKQPGYNPLTTLTRRSIGRRPFR